MGMKRWKKAGTGWPTATLFEDKRVLTKFKGRKQGLGVTGRLINSTPKPSAGKAMFILLHTLYGTAEAVPCYKA